MSKNPIFNRTHFSRAPNVRWNCLLNQLQFGTTWHQLTLGAAATPCIIET